jgi:magnesium-protoporphyrin O-methyltransferase
MSCAQCTGIAQEFDARWARRDLRRYRARGAAGTTRRLVHALRGAGIEGTSFLDVGGGVGAIQHALIAAGASHGTHVDASPAHLAASREEALLRGHADRIRYVEGDFVSLAPELDAADVVTLDRVLCCYHDMPALVDASASRARRLLGMVLPREHLPMRLAVRFLNCVQRLRGRSFFVFLHGTEAVEKRVRGHGFRRLVRFQSPLWQIHLYIKDGGAPAAD